MTKTLVFHDGKLVAESASRAVHAERSLPYGSYIRYPDGSWCRYRRTLADDTLTIVWPDDLPRELAMLALLHT